MKSLLQTKEWAEFKASQGWKAHTFQVANQPIFVLERELAFGKNMLYAPEATLVGVTKDQLQFLAQEAKKSSNSAIFFRLEVFEPFSESTDHPLTVLLTQAGYRKAFEETQPEHRQWVDISHDETVILAGMKEKGRYNVRLAERKGVTTRISTDTKGIEVFYNLFVETAKRNRFTPRGKNYFISICEMLFANNVGEILIAEHEGEPLAVFILTYYDGLASYLYGASSSTKRNLMAPYAAHFAAMKRAKERGCTIYDLLQIAPADAPERHPYTHLTYFKEQFGGQRVDLVGGWDYIYESLLYQVFKIAEKMRRH